MVLLCSTVTFMNYFLVGFIVVWNERLLPPQPWFSNKLPSNEIFWWAGKMSGEFNPLVFKVH